MKRSKKIFIAYMVLVILLTVVRCFLPGEQREERMKFGIQKDRTFELKENRTIKHIFYVQKEKMSGITYAYSKSDDDLQNASIQMRMYQGEHAEKLIQTQNIKMKDQVNDTEIYIQMKEEIPVGEKITVVLTGTGLKDGPVFQISDSAQNLSSYMINGELKNGYLVSSAFYDYEARDMGKIMIDFVVLLFAGSILYLIYKKTGMGFSESFSEKKKEIELRKTRKKERNKKKVILGFLVMVIVSGILMDYFYFHGVKEAANKSSESILTESTKKSSVFPLREGVRLEETFQSRQKELVGIGLGMEETEEPQGFLKVSVSHRQEQLFEAVYSLSELEQTREELSQDSEEQEFGKTVYLNFPELIEASKGEEYTISMEALEMDGKTVGIYYNENTSEKGTRVTIDGKMTAMNLGFSALYQHNQFLKEMYLILCVMLMAMLAILYYMVFWRKTDVSRVFLVGLLFAGSLYILIITAYAVPDEPSHIDTVYRVSNQMMGIESAKGPNRVYKRVSDIDPMALEHRDISIKSYRTLYHDLISKSYNEELESTYASNNLANATRINYLPAAVGFTIARILHLGYLPMLLLGRLLNFLTAVVLMYLGIRKMPFGKALFSMIGILPITIQQIISCSYDPVLIGCAYVFTGYCFFLAFSEEKIYLKDILMLMLSGGLIAACKGGVYLPLTFLILIIPAKRKMFNKKWIPVILMLCACAILLFSRQFASKIFSVVSAAQGTVIGRVEQVELYSASYFIHHPMELIRILEGTFMLLSDHFVTTFVGGLLGWLNIKIPWYVVIGFILLLFLSALRERDAKQYLTIGNKVYFHLISLGCLGLVTLSMLISWTPMGNETILGIQGRYFIPFIGVWLCTLRNSNIVFTKKHSGAILFAGFFMQILVIGYLLASVL